MACLTFQIRWLCSALSVRIGYFSEVFLDLFLQTRIWVFAESLRQEVCAADLSEQLMGVLLHKLLAKIR